MDKLYLALTGGMVLSVAIASLVWYCGSILINANALSGSALGLLMDKFGEVGTLVLSNKNVVLSILWTGVFTTALTSIGENVALKRLSAAEVFNLNLIYTICISFMIILINHL